MEPCLFCKVVNNEIPSYTVYEDAYTKAFLDIYPSAPGHVVLILKKHGWGIDDYSPEDLQPLWSTMQKVLKALTAVYKTEVFSIGSNHKEAQGVHHFHIHIIPRFSDDNGGVIQSLVEKEVKEPLPAIADALKKHIS